MSAAAFVLFASAVLMFGTGPAFALAARRQRRANPAVLAATEPNPMLDHPSLHAHPAAGRIRDRIAANAAARIDAEWEAMNR